MSYERLLRRAYEILVERKYLILLGLLAGLGGGFNFGNSNVTVQGEGQGPRPGFEGMIPGGAEGMGVALAVLIIVLVIVGIAVALLVWVASTLASGALIHGVQAAEQGDASSFGSDWRAAWARVWRLLGVNLLPAIPMLVLLVAGLVMVLLFSGVASILDLQRALAPFGAGVAITFGALLCVVIPVMLVLLMVRTFAYRACMLEDCGVWDSYRRGWAVLTANLGPALILFIIHLGISIGLGVLFLGPGLMMALCCIFWPLLLLLQGVVTAYFSTLWTLAWRTWTAAPLA